MIARILTFLILQIAVATAKELPRKKAPTFNHDIAPLIFSKCVTCHHPDGNAPFSLATYAEAKKRAKVIARVTSKRLMPPWLPEPGPHKFVGERRLEDSEVALVKEWVARGAPEGAPADLKVAAKWVEGWQLGVPDLVIELPTAFSLPAAGKDVYRNFVIPGPIAASRYLRAVEFRPGATSAIHHAFILLESTGQARRMASANGGSFEGMDTAGAGAPEGMFMSWQPGKQVSQTPAGVATRLEKSTDFVLQLHLRPTGKPEQIQPRVGLYFTDEPPTREPVMILLRSVEIDIPAGAKDYAINSSYELPVDADIVSILPHLHYLGKEVRAWADLPDGTRRELLLIKEWDFNWQGDYRYAEPVLLPKGSRLSMRLTFDNSTSNPRNPHQPPKQVTYGMESSDEMGEVWFQLMARSDGDRAKLKQDVFTRVGLPDAVAWAKAMLRKNPKSATHRTNLAVALMGSGNLPEAVRTLEQAIADDPKAAGAHYILGSLYMQLNDAPKAKVALRQAIELDPDNGRAQNAYGWILMSTGDVERSQLHFWKAIEANPTDPLPRQNLERARAMLPPRR